MAVQTRTKRGPNQARLCLQGLLILCLVLVLAHTLTLLNQQQGDLHQSQFALKVKNDFLHLNDDDTTEALKQKHGAQWIPTNPQNKPYPNQPLQDLKVLVAIASFDFSQLPHLEETLDGYHDVCLSGVAKLDIVVHTTVVYPVA